MRPSSIAELLHCSISEARDLNRKFAKLFPKLTKEAEKAYRCNQERGFASTATNLHRYVNTQNRKLSGKDNWLVNHPIQGTAASIFKLAATRLHKLYRFYNARIIIPMHDAFVFEAPLPVFGVVGELTGQVMCQVAQEFLTSLMPRVEVDIEEPECWSQKKKIKLFFKQI
jgi:DNA polymerase I